MSKFMTSQTGKKIIEIHILSNISRSKGKFVQLIEYNMKNIVFKNHGENEAGRLVPDLFFQKKKAFLKVKVSGQHLDFNIFW